MTNLVELWAAMQAVYGHRWTSGYGAEPDGIAAATWATGLDGLTPAQIAAGLRACLASGEGWPPALPEFRALCLGIPDFASVQREMRGGAPVTGFGLLVWQSIDGWAYRHADTVAATRMLRSAYDEAREFVIGGGVVPTPARDVLDAAPRQMQPASPEAARRALDEIASMLGPAPAAPDAPACGQCATDPRMQQAGDVAADAIEKLIAEAESMEKQRGKAA